MTSFKSNDNRVSSKTILPLPPESKEARSEMEIYARFMRHLRMVPNEKTEIKILSSIQFTADILDISDELVAKNLVDMGLRAPRSAFPAEYLAFIDKTLLRSGWQICGLIASSAALKAHWDKIGEDRFAAYRGRAVVSEENRLQE